MQTLFQYLQNSALYKSFAEKTNQKLFAEGLDGFPLFECAHLFAKKVKGNLWIICPTEESARLLFQNADLDEKVVQSTVPTLLLPSSGRVLYSNFEGSSHEFEQLRCFGNIVSNTKSVIITNIRAVCSPIPDKASFDAGTLRFKHGDTIDITKLSSTLAQCNYFRNDSTTMPGEFSLRGEVIDIFPYGETKPARIYLDWDKVEKICTFEPITQRIIKQLGHIDIQTMSSDEKVMLKNGGIKDFFGNDDYFIFCGDQRLSSSFKSLGLEAKSMYRKAYQTDKNAVSPADILFDFDSFENSCKSSLTVVDILGQNENAYKFDIEGPRSYFGNFTLLKEELDGLCREGWKVDIFATSEIQKTRLSQMLSDFTSLNYYVGNISSGFAIDKQKYILICENEIFGRRKQIVKTLQHTQTSVLDSFVELREGDYVVHVNYGIGKFIKIDRLRERDYIKIQFADSEYLYVPIEQANLIQRYIGSSGEAPKVDRLGSGSWENKKAKARKSAEKLASELISLYAKRKNSKGFPFERDNDMVLKFEAEFEYEETEDQLSCIQDIKDDMESTTVMDRLICGDVGYGKTEIAFRAAFKAVMSGKQVAFLAPTTILSEQHYRNFKDRLHDFPVKTALLNRMVPAKEQKKILKEVSNGQIDVLFGTHRIIQKDIIFANLGLLVVDEEQRFGVKDKEKIKELKANIDCLSLSATPIPRTLYMSLLKIRDMSLLTTPPVTRKPIKTVIEQFNLDTIEKAIRFELSRHGQVYFLHNNIETLENVANMLRSRVPEAIVETAHGQMNPVSLEDTMRRFIYEGINVLVSTTIIENGIDIPNVNTIIIDRAERYGISQLYQLKGRVGRSDKEAFAYLFYPNDYVLSELAIKRLQVISEYTDLGSGFKVAMKDMEIRGAGNLLGKEQSGFMSSVGLDMYIRLLDEEISKFQNNSQNGESEVYLELDYSGFIPDSYISDPTVKFDVYKKIACCRTNEELDRLSAELKDRFGNIPDEISNLLYICELRIVCRKLDIYHMKERSGVVTVEFSRIASISVDRLIQMIQTSNGAVTIDPKRLNIMTMKTQAVGLRDKALFILERLQRLVI